MNSVVSPEGHLVGCAATRPSTPDREAALYWPPGTMSSALEEPPGTRETVVSAG